MCKHRAWFRSEHEGLAAVQVIERFFSKPIAREVKSLGARFIKCERKHPVDDFKRLLNAIALQQTKQHFGIGLVEELHAHPLQACGKRSMAVNLAVEDENVAGDWINAWLMPALRIDDRKSHISKRQLPR